MQAAASKKRGKPTGLIGYGPTSFFVESSDYDNLCRTLANPLGGVFPPVTKTKDVCVERGCERVGQGLYCSLGCVVEGAPGQPGNTAVAVTEVVKTFEL